MGLRLSRVASSTRIYAYITEANHKLSKEQLDMMDQYLPDFRIHEPSTEHHRHVAATHWNALFKEKGITRSAPSAKQLGNLNTEQQDSQVSATTTQSGSRVGALYDAFYAYLDQHAPELRPLFRSSLHVKSKILVHISAGMRSILASDRVVEQITTLTKTHLRVGVQLDHFNSLGKALLHAMAVVSEDAWTPEVADAWRHLFAHCSAMLLVTQKKLIDSSLNSNQ